MSDELTKKQKKVLEGFLDELNILAGDVFKDYTINPSELSSSIIEVHENSPLLDDKKNDSE